MGWRKWQAYVLHCLTAVHIQNTVISNSSNAYPLSGIDAQAYVVGINLV